MSEHWHGTPGGYTNHKCRCDSCTASWRDNQRRYMQAHPEQRQKKSERDRARRIERKSMVLAVPARTNALESGCNQNNGADVSLPTNTSAPDGPAQEARYA